MRFEELRDLGFASIVADYTAIGDALDHPAVIITIENFTDALLLFSVDGTTDHFVVPSGGFKLYDIKTNARSSDSGFSLATGTIIYVKRSGIPTSGSVYITTIYNK